MRTDVEQLFLDTLRDLEQRVSAQDAYQILGISALIRKLLLDGCPLTDQVNRERRLKIWFEIGFPRKSPPGFPQPLFYPRQDGFDPDTAPPGTERKKVSRDGLLSARVLTIEGKDYTVQVSPRMGRRNSLSFATFSNESLRNTFCSFRRGKRRSTGTKTSARKNRSSRKKSRPM